MILRTALTVVLFATSVSLADEAKMAPIWKISDENSTVFLAGSVHLLREKDLPLPPAFDRVYAEAEELVFEIDMADMSDPSMTLEIRKLGTLPKGKKLSDSLTAPTMGRLRTYLKNHRMPEAAFDTFTPGMVYLLLGSLEATRAGAKAELGLETIYFEKSKRDGKKSRGLETAAYQMSCFNEFDNSTLEGLLNESLDEVDEGSDTLDSIINAWHAGKSEELASLIVDQTAPNPELQKILLTDRNRNWVPEIEKGLATDQDVMFIVGAAHLVGKDSVISLLREKGYEVSQLANQE
jgi:uncharacterized protein YbaP (TraB family)